MKRIIKNKHKVFFLIIFFSQAIEAGFYNAKNHSDLVLLFDSLKNRQENDINVFASSYTIDQLEYYAFVSPKTEFKKILYIQEGACSLISKKIETEGDNDYMLGDLIEAMSSCKFLEKKYSDALIFIDYAIEIFSNKLNIIESGEAKKNRIFLSKERVQRGLMLFSLKKAKYLFFLGKKQAANNMAKQIFDATLSESKNGTAYVKEELVYYFAVTNQVENFLNLLEFYSEPDILKCNLSFRKNQISHLNLLENLLIKKVSNGYEARISKIRNMHLDYGKSNEEYIKIPVEGQIDKSADNSQRCKMLKKEFHIK